MLTTVHANNVFDVFSRFTHMNIDPYAFASALNSVWAQRLVRIVCPHCAQSHERRPPKWRHSAKLCGSRWPSAAARAGCGDCRGTGYRGRRALRRSFVWKTSCVK